MIELGLWIDYSRKIFRRGIIVPEDISNGYLKLNTNNIGVFKSAYMYNTTNQDESLLYGNYYLDFDNDDYELVKEDVIAVMAYFKVVFGIEYDDMNLYYSGNKGIHLIICKEILGIEPSNELNLVFKSIAMKCNEQTKNKTIDMQIYDNKRMFRVVNSINEKTLLYKIPLTYSELRYLNETEIREMASCQRKEIVTIPVPNTRAIDMFKWFINNYEQILEVKIDTKIKSSGNLKYKPPCIEYLLTEGAISGSRNNILAILASYYNASGVDITSTINDLSNWNDDLSSPLDKREMLATIYSMYRNTLNYGCNTIKNYYKCDNSCKFYKGGNNDGGTAKTKFEF